MPISKLTHDGTLDIATGRDRNTKNWKNRQVSWQELLNKLSSTHRTAESHAEYLASKKSRQDEIKDIGGFVGGYLANGRRKNGSVVHRQLITLDADFATAEFWSDFQLMYDCAACIYSTHKHSPASPRLRLIIPLDREVMADEYIAIVRRIAGNISINDFDTTGFRPTQLMYWPSTAKDGEYVFEYQDGPWLSVDGVLATYHDWKDASEWPMSDREKEMPLREIKKQGDPLEKPGVVGAFCRTYSVSEAIETFLGDVYEPCDVEDRYSYKEGSTAAGLVVYEDKYAFSHHGTDPISGKLCNAFDLVRLHKYGLKDEDCSPDMPINKKPSYLEMQNFARSDKKVVKQIGIEKLQKASEDFSDDQYDVPSVEGEPEDTTWLEQMDADRKGNYSNTYKNTVLILENDPVFKGKIAYDVFSQQAVFIKGKISWREVDQETKFLTSSDDDFIEYYIEKKYGITVSSKYKKALSVFCMKHCFHPIKDFLNSVKWDGKPRLDTLFIDYMGAADTDYTRAVTRKALTAAVARIFEPGIKFDHLLTLVGDQGKKKSSILSQLGGEWFSDTFNIRMLERGKEGFEQVRGVWLLEVPEMVGMAKADVNHIKSFLTSKRDRYRPAYGDRVQSFPRQCVIFGTTNSIDFLRDTTGNRRFWPVDILQQRPTKDVFKDLVGEEINQVWAEALMRYRKKEPLYLSPAMEVAAANVQQEHLEEDPRASEIHKYLERPISEPGDEFNDGPQDIAVGSKRDKVCASEIWIRVFNGQAKDMNTYNTKFIHDILSCMEGWKRSKSKNKTEYGKQIIYYRVDSKEALIHEK